MRRFFVLVVLLASTVGLRAASFEARSPHYAVTIDVVPLGAEDTRYDVRLTDLATSQVLASPQLTAKRGGTADDELHVQGLNVWIHVAEGSRLTVNVEIERDVNPHIETLHV